jgi:hypothetical protein
MISKADLRPVFAYLALAGFALLAALGSLFLAKVTGTFEGSRHNICFSVNSSSSGVTQLFWSKAPGAFNELQSASQVLSTAPQRVCFAIGIGERFLRWDPNNVASDMRISQVEVTFWGLRQSLPLDLLTLANGLKSSSQNMSSVEMIFDNDDPQISFEISAPVKIKELAYSAALLTFFYLLMASFTLFILRKLISEKSIPYRLSVMAALLLFAVYQVTGLIAVGDGAGWDGNAYLNLLFDWKNSGYLPSTDPYRVSRLSGFFPAVAAEFLLDLTRLQLVYVQMVFNVVSISIAAGLFTDYLLTMGAPTKRAVQFTTALLLTWPILVMSTYYPLLSDHLAIVLSCWSLWCFSHKKFKWLLVSCLITPLIMPGLFLLPLTLLTFSQTEAQTSLINRLAFRKKSRLIVFLVLGTVMVTYACHWFTRIADSELLHIGSTLAPGLPQYRWLSSTYLILGLIGVAWLWSCLLKRDSAFSVFSIKRFLLAVTSAACGHAILYLGLDWNQGFRGPNLMQNMFYQGLNTPFKPILSHFIYFGPCFLVALQLVCASNRCTPSVRPVQIAILGFLPLLLVGSESRQWIAILPFLVAYVAQSNVSDKAAKLILYFSISMALPLFWLATCTSKAFALGLPMVDPLWQLYFGRQGPWMSHSTYLIGAATVFFFVTLCWLTRSTAAKPRAQIG